MKITTERLLLRPWEDSDAANLYQYAKHPQVGPRAGWPPHTSQAQSLEIIQTVLRDPYSFAVCLKESGEMIGAIGFHDSHSPHIHPENHEKELGYWLGVPFWGQGLMPEAIEAMSAFGFEELLLNAIWCGYYEGNEQSKRAQEKCGFTYHHTLENVDVPLLKEVRTEHFTRLTKEEWHVKRGK